MKFRFHFKGEEVVLENVRLCKNWKEQARGLMFRRDLIPCVFVMKNSTRMAIHSFFCKSSFVAIWMDKGNLVDIKIVNPWKLHVAPKNSFDCLIEIPFKSKNQISRFLVENKKGLNSP